MNKNPIVPFLLIIFLGIGLIFLLSSQGANAPEDEGGGTASNEQSGQGDSGEGGEEGSEGGGSEQASSGDFDAEGFARDNCASCHGEDFSGGTGPALAGTSLSEEDFSSTVREGPASMPAFSEDQIADEDLTALYEYLAEQ